MTTNLKGPLMPPGNHILCPCCSHSPTISHLLSPQTSINHVLPTLTLNWALGFLIHWEYEIRRKLSLTPTAKSIHLLDGWVWDILWRWNQQELERHLMWGMRKRKEPKMRFKSTQTLLSQQGFPLLLSRHTHSHTLSLSLSYVHTPYLLSCFLGLFFFQYQLSPTKILTILLLCLISAFPY